MIYSIIGTGGIGGYYGGRLAQAGHNVHFLLHSDYEHVKQHGLRVDSVNGDFHLANPNIYNDAKKMPVSDVVVVCLKTTNNHLLPELLQTVADEHTIVILIQNGIGVEEDAQNMLPELQLVAGLAFICTAKVAPGHINHQCYGQINLGNYSCNNETLLQQIAEDFTQAGIPAAIVDYKEARWKKAVWNMPFNGMTVALNTQTDILLKNPATRQLIREQMMEIVNAAKHQGINGVDEAFVDKMISMTDEMTPYSPSMKLDYDFHRPMEINYIYSRPLKIARSAGMPMPKLEMLEAELRFLEDNHY
ncbi:MAG: putative 2-dehydropantoate 2-reductase [Prevotellaceae bacterium]|nr:putative 2-dehydropantoate 2-reductase [Candidatus Minthosoma equi]